MKCFIILPCFNEERNIKPLIHSINEVLESQLPYKIIAVNDGSYDQTCEILKDLSMDYPVEILEHPRNMGLGAALRTGLLAVAEESFEDDFVVIMDSDNTHNPKHVLDMVLAAENADVVVGSRYIKGGAQLNVPIHRVVLSKAINLLVRKLFQLPLKDATSGFRCFRAVLVKRLSDAFQDSIIESEGFTASLELLLKAVRSGGVVAEVPILLDYGKKGGASKMRLFSTIINYVILLFRFRKLNSSKRFC
ncbi:MAG: glycosyltransferase family 2 protein [Candidatus Bathyarchaeota archaeon]|nr:glycosyltransferase family 2 protein [Candidatus Bathyarchaeota archaeon A05DMB-5]MDH7557720.1 glycosyltransferase family 2 protein [Candidatus Bathyarchaeota archaeon]